jgi:HD-GYP domain-containing protein (c-di-GMP phosphodiesterase class II)
LSATTVRNAENRIDGFIGTYLDLRSMKHTDQLQKNALKATINAVCKAVDERNVLKGQHQEQVTDLAVAIAFEMGKDLNFIEGLTLAAHLHDLGEMYIPPEISAKEGALSVADFELVKIHPIKAYEILKDIKYPWPVANIILQHHERMNGSGYPKGLKGDEIMMEARILAVADVVCTMLTDRPYRSACSITKCIDELEINKDTLYDPRVVEVCLRLIREKSYQLKTANFTVAV